MLSTTDLERLITVKRREIEHEKTLLGLKSPPNSNITAEDINQNEKNVTFVRPRAYSENDKSASVLQNDDSGTNAEGTEELVDERDAAIPPDLERYIRRYLGLPRMLKAGEFSPNNPLVRVERSPGDALLGLGEYERRRNTLRKAQQRQYREYLDQQAKKKQEAKEQAERERREREEKEKLEEERARQRLELERERDRSPERRRASYTYVSGANSSYVTKVDTGVQVDYRSAPLSVAVQTDGELYTPSQLLTQAERELSPHTAEPRAHWGRRRSCGDYDRVGVVCAAGGAATVPRYTPSILDGDVIQRRNQLAEQEAAERRQWYRRELRHQVAEQQRLRHERAQRERLLEQAEMRRLEGQLRTLDMVQRQETSRQRALADTMKESANEYDRKRTTLQREIDAEQQLLLKSRHARNLPHDVRPPAYDRLDILDRPDRQDILDRPDRQDILDRPDKPDRQTNYSFNIPDNSIFSHNYDLDSYLRRNLNPTKERISTFDNAESNVLDKTLHEPKSRDLKDGAAIRDLAKDRVRDIRFDSEANYIPEISMCELKIREPQESKCEIKTIDRKEDTLPIPVLRHSPKRVPSSEPETGLSEAMRMVDDKWKVPVVQKNFLKSLPGEGKGASILTQLGSIRRQLQMEQMKLDKMLSRNNQV